MTLMITASQATRFTAAANRSRQAQQACMRKKQSSARACCRLQLSGQYQHLAGVTGASIRHLNSTAVWHKGIDMKRFRHYFWNKGEPWNSVRSWVLPRLLRVLHSLLMCTLRISASGVRRSDTLMEKGGILYVTWHDLTLMPLHLFRDKNIGVMMSRSHSGQIQSAFWNMYGWPTVWGSTNKREGIRALREVLRSLRNGQSFAFTPDGPKGPRHQAHAG